MIHRTENTPTPFGTPTQNWVNLQMSVFDLVGSDASEWLQGQMTNDLGLLEGSPESGLIGACFCNQKGHIQFISWIQKPDGYLRVLVPNDKQNLFLHRFEQFVVAEDVEIVHQRFECWAVFNESTRETFVDEVISISPLKLRASNGENVHLFDQTCSLVFTDPDFLPGNTQLVDSDWVVGKRLTSGFPHPNLYGNSVIFPQELGSIFEHCFVSYKKGCYLGQEVVMRIHSQGHTNREWIRVKSDHPLAEGTPILTSDGVEVGRVLESGLLEDGTSISSAFVRRNHLEGQFDWQLDGGERVSRV